MDLKQKILNKQAKISVIGLGYVGLPLAIALSTSGFKVYGIDTDKNKIKSIVSGKSFIEDVKSEDLFNLISTKNNKKNSFEVSPNYSSIEISDVIIICVPTPLTKNKEPDISYIQNAVHSISEKLKLNTMVILESTTYPGTTEEILLPVLQSSNNRNLKAGKDFYLGYSPERIDPGRINQTIHNTPKVVAGITKECSKLIHTFYETIVDKVVTVSTTKTAEMVKILENTFRSTNVALANEIYLICDKLGINVWEVIDAAKSKPFGFMPFYPGPGIGGHCIPIDPHLLEWKLKTLNYNTRFIGLSSEINESMPQHWIEKTQDFLKLNNKSIKNSKILILGVAYKPDVADTRESPSLCIIEKLITKGAKVDYHDPLVKNITIYNNNMKSISNISLEKNLRTYDCIIITTNHSTYDWNKIQEKTSSIIDTRNALKNN
ncbi:MAG: UDP-N-acetyl-D-glucosamine dehydrogenase [Chloroflexi bacterium]|nr:UDP-N-acetyl-D-glucosamine dehydrogenase [Chloroflexota bacterium]|tara:strand:+ start:19802 stop:21103 length:1302 start_codon:yes stop_codon:yes gene_type:complete